MTASPAPSPPRSPLGWLALLASSFCVFVAAFLAFLVLTAEPAPPPEPPKVERDPHLISQEADNRFFLPVDKAILDGADLAIEDRAVGSVIGGWKSRDDRIRWRLQLKHAGIYEIQLTYSNAFAEGEAAGRYQFRCGENRISSSARPSGGVNQTVRDRVYLKLEPAGEIELELSALQIPRGELMAIKEVAIVPRLRQRSKY
jgi:hypothetical protein